ncbi:DUF2306 domain-containing protein [Chachezhania sediminis]|uniref:DUF2306 domain-containing protein n=1 Tax=Chachezhania sediminis TaxID=2599291 RepID=UPI00131CAD86|nr:DUF2306 domain-containing protein [Chachezhania sediminis]
MALAPLWAARPPIPLHAVAAMAACVLGLGQLALPKGTRLHVWTGRVWIALMAAVAVSSFFIHTIRMLGPFSPLHVLSAVTLFWLWAGMRAARRGQIDRHRRIMLALFFMALLLTGAFTVLPGRVMHEVILGG